jgi:hypothetical protein
MTCFVFLPYCEYGFLMLLIQYPLTSKLWIKDQIGDIPWLKEIYTLAIGKDSGQARQRTHKFLVDPLNCSSISCCFSELERLHNTSLAFASSYQDTQPNKSNRSKRELYLAQLAPQIPSHIKFWYLRRLYLLSRQGEAWNACVAYKTGIKLTSTYKLKEN